MDQGQHENAEAEKKQAIENAKAISEAAKVLYRLIPSGACIRIEWFEQPAIVTRDSVVKKHVLNVNKPLVDLVMTFKTK